MQVMNNQAGMYGIKKKNNKSLEILKNLNLDDKANAYSRSLSGGMKRRLGCKSYGSQPSYNNS